jgi:hypothetical protein
MSRRSQITDEENLLRSQRLGVPNATMWSESPVPPVVEWDGAFVEAEVEGGV